MKKAKLNQLNLKKLTVSKLSESIKGGKNVEDETKLAGSFNNCRTEQNGCVDSYRYCYA